MNKNKREKDVSNCSLNGRSVEVGLLYLDDAYAFLAGYHVGGTGHATRAGHGVVGDTLVGVCAEIMGVAAEVYGVAGEVHQLGVFQLHGSWGGVGCGVVWRDGAGFALVEPPAVAVVAGHQRIVLHPHGGLVGMTAHVGFQTGNDLIGSPVCGFLRGKAEAGLGVGLLEPEGLAAIEFYAPERYHKGIELLSGGLQRVVGYQIYAHSVLLGLVLVFRHHVERLHIGVVPAVVADAVGYAVVAALPVVGHEVVVAAHRDEGDAGIGEASHGIAKVVAGKLAVRIHVAEAEYDGRLGGNHLLYIRLHGADRGAVVRTMLNVRVAEYDNLEGLGFVLGSGEGKGVGLAGIDEGFQFLVADERRCGVGDYGAGCHGFPAHFYGGNDALEVGAGGKGNEG